MSSLEEQLKPLIDRLAVAMETKNSAVIETAQDDIAELIWDHGYPTIMILLNAFYQKQAYQRAAALDMLTMVRASEDHKAEITKAAIEGITDDNVDVHGVSLMWLMIEGNEQTIPAIIQALTLTKDSQSVIDDIEQLGNQYARTALDVWRRDHSGNNQ